MSILISRVLIGTLIISGYIFASCEEAPAPVFEPPGPIFADPGDDGVFADSAWRTALHRYDGIADGITPQPLQGGELIAFVHNGLTANVLYHVDAETGVVVDSFPIEHPDLGFGSLTEYAGDGLRIGDDYVAKLRSRPFRFSLRDGTVSWRLTEVYSLGSVLDGKLYAGRSTSRDQPPMLAVIDLESGSVIDSIGSPEWHRIENSKGGFDAIRAFRRPADGSVTVATTLTYINSDSSAAGNIDVRLGYDLATKRELWRHREPGLRNFSLHPPVYAGGLIVQAGTHEICGYDPATGEEVWRYDPWYLPYPSLEEAGVHPPTDQVVASNGSFNSAPFVNPATGYVYFASLNYYQFCLDPATGQEVWRGGGRGAPGSTFAPIGAGMLSSASTGGTLHRVVDMATGELLTQLERYAGSGAFTTALYYDAERNLLVGFDGAHALAWRPRFEIPGG